MKLFKNRSGAASGFTLLEVVVALTIVGLGVVTLLEIFSSGLRLGARSSVHTEAAAYARQVMDEILARGKWLESSEQGTIDGHARWKVQVQTVRDASPSLNLSSPWILQEITLDMMVMDAGRDRHIELKTVRLVKKQNP